MKSIKSTLHNQRFSSSSDQIVPFWSFGKTVVAYLVIKNKIELDAVVSGFDFTYRQLLMHTSGLPDYGSDPKYQQDVSQNKTPWSLEDLLNDYTSRERLFPAGEGWMYSNVGYALLRKEIEQHTNRSLSELISDIPDLKNCTLAITPEELASTFFGNPRNYHPKWVMHGLIIGPADSAVSFLHNNAKIFSGETCFTDLSHFQSDERPWGHPAYGMGVMLDFAKDKRLNAIGHTGQGSTSTCAIYHFPEENITKAFFCTSQNQGQVEYELTEGI